MRRSRPVRFLGILTFLPLLSVCSSSSTGPEGEGITGTWSFLVKVTVANGVCAGEENYPGETAAVTIVEAGGAVTASGPWFADSGTYNFTGTRSGNTVTVSGSYVEEGGTTTSTYQLTVGADESTMTGTESWSWTGSLGVCADNSSDVTAARS